jgi:hypothetical protein
MGMSFRLLSNNYFSKHLTSVLKCITFVHELLLTLMKTESIIIRVDKDMKAKLIKLAEENRRELSDFMRIVIEDLIKKKIKVA